MSVVYAVSKDEMHITYHVRRKEMSHITIPSYVDIDTQHCGCVGCGRGNSLSQVYGSYSSAKAAAWEHCESLCSDLDGHHLCITSANAFIFTAQFEFVNPENGRPMVCHITPTQTYAMYLDMRHIDTARDAWREYATIFGNTTDWPDLQDLYDGVHVVWVGSEAYVIAHDEVYRVADAWTANHKLRKRVVLHRIGRYDDCCESMAAAVADAAGQVYDRAQ